VSSIHYRPTRIRARRSSSEAFPVAVGFLLDQAGDDYIVMDLTTEQAEQLAQQLDGALRILEQVRA
jgi:hypothetical protein